MNTQTTTRNKELAKIHIAAKQLGIEGDIYRDMLWVVARVLSSKDLDEHGRKVVIAHLKKCGARFQPKKKPVGEYPGTPHNINRQPYLHKIEAQLASMKLPWSYAERIAWSVTGGKGNQQEQPGIEKLAWVKRAKHFDAIIAALHVEQEKRSLLQRVDDLLAELGKDRSYIDELTTRQNWQRHRITLNAIISKLIDKVETK